MFLVGLRGLQSLSKRDETPCTTMVVVSLFYTSFKVPTTACFLRTVNYYSKPDCWASAINDVHKIWGPPILKSLLNITQYKKLAINTLRFTYWNFKSCKSHENNETKDVRSLVFSFSPINFAFCCFLFCFFMWFVRFQILIREQQSICRKLILLSWLYQRKKIVGISYANLLHT